MVWSPDSTRIAYVGQDQGYEDMEVFVVGADGKQPAATNQPGLAVGGRLAVVT